MSETRPENGLLAPYAPLDAKDREIEALRARVTELERERDQLTAHDRSFMRLSVENAKLREELIAIRAKVPNI